MSDEAIAAGSENQAIDRAVLQGGLRTVRRRRWYLWMIILVYMPLMGVAMTYKAVGPVFICWFVVMFVIALYAALARCPRCGNYFHMHGMTLLYLRKCLHCQLHLTADKRL